VLKRCIDESFCDRRINLPIYAHSTDCHNHGIHAWDFTNLGESAEERHWSERICGLFPGDNESGVIIRGGFKNEEPATYKWFIATYTTREETLHVSNHHV
jgi:hypothetical protein